MTPAEIQHKLQAGIEAAKRGQKQQAQTLLLDVVELDERNEQAWLWLSAVMNSLHDKRVALENVLAINPQNTAAQKGLASIKSQLAAERWNAPDAEQPFEAVSATKDEAALDQAESLPPITDSLEDYAPHSPVEPIAAIDDPYQCLYCGAPATSEMKHCPECKRSLVVKQGSKRLSTALRSAAFAVMAVLALAALEALALVVFHYQGHYSLIRYVFEHANLDTFFGDYLKWSTELTPLIMWLQFGWLVVLTGIILGLLYQVAFAYYASIGLLVMNLIWGVFRWANGYLGIALTIPELVISMAALSLIFASQRDFEVNDTRLRCAVDPRLKGGQVFNRLGHEYKHKGQWGLAVAYWRAAVGAMPNQPAFYKDLAVGYAQIGYYERALRALDEFARQSPGHADVPPMREIIEQKRTADPNPRG